MTDFQSISYLSPEGILKEGVSPISSATLIQGYKTMCLTRQVDDRMIILQRQGAISFALSSRGEEACAVAGAAALENADWIYPQYRELGILFWRGYTVENYLHHMFGDEKDSIFGRQMPNHFGSREHNIVNVSSPIATQIPHAAGSAYAMKITGAQSVTMCYFGEGATSEGDFHCGLNFAAVRKAPVIFFCRNNQYAISTPTKDQYACNGIASKGEGYGIKTFKIDGNDFFATYATVKQARDHCLSGQGPVLIEAMTYRMGSHSTSDDPTRYRKEEEVESWRSRCPILRLKRYLEKQGLWNQDQENALQEEIKGQIDKAVEAAKATPLPPIDSLIEYVYFEKTPELHHQLEERKGVPPCQK